MAIYEFTKLNKSPQDEQRAKIMLLEDECEEFEPPQENQNVFAEKHAQKPAFSLWKAVFFFMSASLAFLGVLLSLTAIVIFASAACVMLCQNHFFNNLVWVGWEFLKFLSVLTVSFAIAIFSPSLGMGLLGMKIAFLQKEYVNHLLNSFITKMRAQQNYQ